MCFSSYILIRSKHVWVQVLSKMILRIDVESLITKILRIILKHRFPCHGITFNEFLTLFLGDAYTFLTIPSEWLLLVLEISHQIEFDSFH